MAFLNKLATSASKFLQCASISTVQASLIQRHLSILSSRQPSTRTSQLPAVSSTLLAPSSVLSQQTRTYKVKSKLTLRCSGCYFERRNGRLFVECTLKGRHKQMQQVKGLGLYKDDYSGGQWKKGLIWGYVNKKFYKYNNKYTDHKLYLKDRVGKDL